MRLARGGKAREKIIRAFAPRNPLKYQDSDERIQANPRQTNPDAWGVQPRTALRQGNPNAAPATADREA
jgi:hypothetical protein